VEACSGGSSSSSSGGSSAVPAAQSSFSLLSCSSSSFALSFPFLLPADCCAIRHPPVFNALVNGSDLVNGWLLRWRSPTTPPTTSTKAADDRRTCHHCSSPSSSSSSLVASCQQDDRPLGKRRTMTTVSPLSFSSSLVASCQQDDRPPGKRRTMTTTIAATMATDRPPYRLLPLHLGDVAITSSCPPCVGRFHPLSFRHCCHPTLRCHHSPHAHHSHRRCCLSSCVIPTTISESFVLIISPPGHHPARIHFCDDAPPAPSSPHTQQHPRGLVRGGGRRRTQGDIARRRPRPGRGLGG
jgi:hypothetical protein